MRRTQVCLRDDLPTAVGWQSTADLSATRSATLARERHAAILIGRRLEWLGGRRGFRSG
jgi:hypothetical protein